MFLKIIYKNFEIQVFHNYMVLFVYCHQSSLSRIQVPTNLVVVKHPVEIVPLDISAPVK